MSNIAYCYDGDDGYDPLHERNDRFCVRGRPCQECAARMKTKEKLAISQSTWIAYKQQWLHGKTEPPHIGLLQTARRLARRQ